ncbi:hypothetical protein H4Q32_031093 [Labeo rohita]|uniref:Integrase catalytic domain-containing protein n=1 Tax=Labeo rohita TaxID=84645 RepID=A0ABQ8L1B0_LABRO|nr:hypothetical protein H4Q32_031093 [Labeo rohita]
MNKKDLDNVPLRCQRLLMRLMRFKLTAEYAPGKTLLVADMLSRNPLACKEHDINTHSDVECYTAAVAEGLPASPPKLEAIRAATMADNNLQIVLNYIRSGWPNYVDNIPVAIRKFFPFKNELSEHDGILTRGSRMLIPDVVRADILNRIHDGHQGLTKCRERAITSVWWLDRPWKRLAMDLCEHNKHTYLVVSDYFSRFLEILYMPTITTSEVVLKLKALFARFGCPDKIVSDNGRQFVNAEFQEFAKEFDFLHITSSPHHAQGNGHADRGVQIAKKILQQKDPLLALMSYRATPCISTGVSPAELLMGRKIKTTLPMLETNLQPQWPNLKEVRRKDSFQAFYFNRHHGARPLPLLKSGMPCSQSWTIKRPGGQLLWSHARVQLLDHLLLKHIKGQLCGVMSSFAAYPCLSWRNSNAGPKGTIIRTAACVYTEHWDDFVSALKHTNRTVDD